MTSDMNNVGFCGDPFLDDFQVLRNSTRFLPVPTACFSHTVLVFLPCFVFWSGLPVLIVQIKHSIAHSLPWTVLQSMKWLITSVVLVEKLVVLGSSLWSTLLGSTPVPTIELIYPIVMAITMLGLLLMMNECRRAGIGSSGVIFCTWLCFAIFGAPEFYAWLTIGTDQSLVGYVDFVTYVGYLAYYPLVLIQVVLLSFSDPLTIFDKGNRGSPEEGASFLNQQTLYWFGDLVARGKKKPLEVDDVFELDSALGTEYLSNQWYKEWNVSLKDYEMRKRALATQQRYLSKEQSPLLGKNGKNYGTENNSEAEKVTRAVASPPSIIGIMWRLYHWELIGGTIVKLFSDLLQFANPAFLNMLISFSEDPLAPWWEGVGYALGLFSCSVLRFFLLNNYFTIMFRASTKIQSVLTSAVYDKTLQLSNKARRLKTQGEIVNLMAIDVDRFRTITPQVQQYWSSPLQITICMILLWQTLGPSVIAGVVVMLSTLPLNLFVAKFTRNWQMQLMKKKDERIRMTGEVLSGIKVIKLYAWEPALEEAINKIRIEEMSLVKKSSLVKTLSDMYNVAAPFFVALVSFTTFSLVSSSNVLTPQIAFVSLTLFNQLRSPLMMVADLISQTVQAIVSNKRLKEFLVADELDESSIDRDKKVEFYEHPVDVDNCTFAWEKEAPAQLTNIMFKVPRHALIAVVGTVGAGKSSLLAALLGEMEKLRGYIGIRGTAAFVPQQAWIQNRSLRDNILMEKPYNKVVYDEIIEACALKPDIHLLPHGDQTEIGEKGINLSGGQKARVALARAVYQDRDLYLLDDPLSAVDAHVARHIFEKVVGPNGLLAKKTRILVTHGQQFLKDTSCIAIMNHGTITHLDTYERLCEDEAVEKFLREVDVQRREDTTPDSNSVSTEQTADDELDDEPDSASVISRKSRASRRSNKSKVSVVQKLIENETSETGRVKLSVYVTYFKAMGFVKYFVTFVVAMTLNVVFVMMRSFWLTDWSNDNVPGAQPTYSISTRLLIYAGLGFSEVFFLFFSMACSILGGVHASLKLHSPLLHNILRSPLAFFDVTPLGRILNRLGKDMEIVDLRLPSNFRFLVVAFFSVIQTVTVISISTPLFIGIIVPVFIVYMLILRYFITTSRQLQRLSSTTRSPIYSHFGETIQGAATIRAFGWQEQFKQQNRTKLNAHIRCSYFSLMSNRWLSVRLEMLGNIIILATALLAVASKYMNTMSAGIIGLSVSYSLNITFMMNLFVRQVSEVETNVVSVERVNEYSHTPTEASWTSDRSLPVGWPSKGRLAIRDYSTRYRPGLELVLKGLTMTIVPGEKVGVVGRTGAGKSSLALALFRIVEPAGGQIILDDVDVATIGLHDLRNNLTIIPQDPVLFSGTLRFNLDPTNVYSDSDLWVALEHSNLKPFVESLPKALDHPVDEDGENISVGQRQLVCLTRALLRKTKVLVLDEATASVDSQTDALIQSTIRTQFADSTVITVAHRLNTIMDYDRILVMDGGRVAEYDTPQDLLANKKSLFYSMAQSAKLV